MNPEQYEDLTDYIQILPGDGKSGPAPDNFTPWNHTRTYTREEIREMAMRKHLREAGFEKNPPEKPYTFTVWHYREGDPVHASTGRPKVVHAVTYTVEPRRKALA